jgi:hypothetical protein
MQHVHPNFLLWFDHNNILWLAQIMKLLNVLFPPASCYIILLRCKYFPSTLFSNNLHLRSFLLRRTKFYTLMKQIISIQ